VLLLSLVLYLVFFPKLRYNIEAEKQSIDSPWHYRAKISYLLGIIRVIIKDGTQPVIKIFGIKLKTKAKNDEEAEETPSAASPTPAPKTKMKAEGKKKAEKEQKPPKDNPLDTFKEYYRLYQKHLGKGSIRAILSHTITLLKDILLKILPKDIRVRGVVGLDEPDQTGMLFAAISPLAIKFDIRLAGNFEEKTLELEGQARGGFRLISFVWPIVAFLKKEEIVKLRFLIKTINKRNRKRKLKQERMLQNGYRI